MNLASLKIRFIAKLIDIIFAIVLYLLNLLLASLVSSLFIVVPPVFGITHKLLNYINVIDISIIVIEVISFAIYFSFVVAKYEGTIGKRIFRIKLVTINGVKLTPYRAIARFAAELLSAALFGLGYLIALFDPEKRTLHDRICSTRVVRTR